MTFLSGVMSGVVISLCFSFGPAFFCLLQNSVHYGFRKSIPFVFGVSLNDCLIVGLLLTIFNGVDVSRIMHAPLVSLGSAAILTIIGIIIFRRKVETSTSPETDKHFAIQSAPQWYSTYFHGFIINFVNPIIWIYWIGIIALASGTLNIQQKQLPLFFIGVLATTLTLDILKCKLSSQLQKFLTARILNIFNKCIGIVIFGFAIYILITMLTQR